MLTFVNDVAEYLFTVFNAVIEILIDFGEALIRGLRWIFIRIIKFLENIVDYFRQLAGKYEQEPDIVGFSYLIDQEMQAGNVTVIKGIMKNPNAKGAIVKGVYDKKKKTVLNEDIEVNEFEELDEDTAKQFGDNHLLIIE